ncbi:isochorismatase family protein [Pseudoalteromonas tunicata]|uniref:isochorismatase family protein n=1 Tax=Pseudoalteromonas tunicata TaxID=314281 RepID=UPI00273D935F|nr:isochorismatase family protein [Pseudoalteromonas tunicata]MDP5214674.1 isochorismatase family protein [Pseudoalteromonas tunicata]
MLHKSTTGLIVVDIQGKLATLVHNSDALISQTKKLIIGAHQLSLPILWLEQNPTKLGPTTPCLAECLSPNQVIEKYSFDATGTELFNHAVQQSGIKQWLICGIEAHICVYQTAIGLLQVGHQVEIVADCVSSRSEFNKQLALNKLLGLGAHLTSVEMCLFELVADCKAPEFKAILQLIK